MSNSVKQNVALNNGDIAARDINKITINNHCKDDFQVNALFELMFKLFDSIEERNEELIDIKAIELQDKNKINNLESYFNEFIVDTIKYHDSIEQIIQNLDDDDRDKFKVILKSLKHFIYSEDDSRILTSQKFQNIFKNFYNKGIPTSLEEYLETFIYYLYCSCHIGEKNDKG